MPHTQVSLPAHSSQAVSCLGSKLALLKRHQQELKLVLIQAAIVVGVDSIKVLHCLLQLWLIDHGFKHAHPVNCAQELLERNFAIAILIKASQDILGLSPYSA